jgi:hypothetical protein
MAGEVVREMRRYLSKPEVKFPLLIFAYSRILFYTVAFIWTRILDVDFSTDTFCHWDCGWYLSIINNGYMHGAVTDGPVAGQANWAFFPVFPYLVKISSWISGIEVLRMAYFLNNLCFLIALIYLYKYLIIHYPSTIVRSVIVLMALSPVNVYLMSLYTESTYLALLITTVYYIKKHKWITAGVLGALLGATRNTGIFIIAAYILEYQFAPELRVTKIIFLRYLVGLAIFPSGLLLFMFHLKLRTGDPLAFYHIQSAWGKLPGNAITFILDTLRNPQFLLILFLLLPILSFSASIYFILKKRTMEFIVLMPITLLTIYSTRVSYRFFLVLFPLYMIVAEVITRKKWMYLSVIFLEVICLLVSTKLWITGYGPS